MHSRVHMTYGLIILGLLIIGPMMLTTDGGMPFRSVTSLLAFSQQPVQSQQPSKTASQDTRNSSQPSSQSRPTRGIVEALREQVRNSQILEESGAQQELLDSLEQAGDLWAQTKAQNREALRRLKREPRIGQSSQAPHLVLITVDRWSDDLPLESKTKSPWSEWASQGMSFLQHYAGGSDVESGFWSLLTGMNTGHAPHSPGESRLLRATDRQTLPHMLWNSGYETAYVGPWSSSVSPLDVGWDYWSGIRLNSKPMTKYPAEWISGEANTRIAENAAGQELVTVWELISADVRALLARQKDRTRPLFLQIRLPLCDAETSADTNTSWNGIISKVFTEIKELKIEQQTCVVLTALSGAEPENHRSPLGEGNLRIPLVMIWPGHIPANQTRDHVTAAWDLWPTFLDIGFARPSRNASDGLSLAPTLANQTQPEHELLYWKTSTRPAVQAVRQGRWKLHYNPQNQQLQLFDLVDDPTERTNVAETHQEIVKTLLKGPEDAVQQVLKSPSVSEAP